MTRTDAEVTIQNERGQFHINDLYPITEDGFTCWCSVIYCGDFEKVGADIFWCSRKEGINESDAILHICSILGYRRDVRHRHGHRLPFLGSKKADVEVKGVVEADKKCVIASTSRRLSWNGSLVGISTRNVNAKVLSVQPKRTVLLICGGTIWAIVKVGGQVESAELNEVVAALVFLIHTNGCRVRSTATA